MEKPLAILFVEMPESCYQCTLCADDHDEYYCAGVNRYIDVPKRRAGWCPLVPIEQEGLTEEELCRIHGLLCSPSSE